MKDMKTCYRLTLLDTCGTAYITFVNEETWHWINHERMPPPEAQVKLWSNQTRKEVLESLRRWEGSSPENDRAILAHPDFGKVFLLAKDALLFAKENKLDVIDEFIGYMY